MEKFGDVVSAPILTNGFRFNSINEIVDCYNQKYNNSIKYNPYYRSLSRRDDMSKSVYEIVECPHCLKSGRKASFVRWHFENCKEKGN